MFLRIFNLWLRRGLNNSARKNILYNDKKFNIYDVEFNF